MTTEQRVQTLNIVAGQDLTSAAMLHKAMTVNGTVAQNSRETIGFLKSHGPAGLGVTVADQGVVKVYAGAAVSTVGFPLAITGSGYVVPAFVGSACIGKAFSTAASGNLFAIQCDCSNLGVA